METFLEDTVCTRLPQQRFPFFHLFFEASKAFDILTVLSLYIPGALLSHEETAATSNVTEDDFFSKCSLEKWILTCKTLHSHLPKSAH